MWFPCESHFIISMLSPAKLYIPTRPKAQTPFHFFPPAGPYSPLRFPYLRWKEPDKFDRIAGG